MKKFFIRILPAISGSEVATYQAFNHGVFEEYQSMADLNYDQKALVSFEWNELTHWLMSRKEAIPSSIIDLEQIAKQLSGIKRENSEYSLWNIVKPFYLAEDMPDLEKIQKIHYGFETENAQQTKKLYQQLLKAMSLLYADLQTKLIEKDEQERYSTVESKIRTINLFRSYEGIHICTSNVADWINSLTKSVYKLRNNLQLNYGIISLSDKATIIKKIELDLISADILEMIKEKGYYCFLKDSRHRSPLINALFEEKKATNDLNALLAIGALKPVNNLVHPQFDSFGTITARTKVTAPNFQHLSRKFRSIITSPKGKKLLYIDYAQFEAGILANDSKDQVLIGDYNNSDIYTEIGKRIGIETYIPEEIKQRKFCKNLFYKYSYGMDIKNHANVLKDFNLYDHQATLSPKILEAFEKYERLEKYREEIKKELTDKGRIGTHLGNYRYKLDNETRLSWALSQRIQGTASLILKKAIINVTCSDKEIEFLLPMHDAALFQVPKETHLIKMDSIKRKFEYEFQNECPLITPLANFKNFTD